MEDEYHESIESYKGVSWFNFSKKLKKTKEVRNGKRATRQANRTLRNLSEVRCFRRLERRSSLINTKSMSSGSDTSSICASSGSPLGSNLAVDDIRDWTYAVHETVDVDAVDDDTQIENCGSAVWPDVEAGQPDSDDDSAPLDRANGAFENPAKHCTSSLW